MTTKTILIALVSAAFATTTLLNGNASAGGLTAQGPTLTAQPLSDPITDKQPKLGVTSPVKRTHCTKFLFGTVCY
jgi:hypothetical protein